MNKMMGFSVSLGLSPEVGANTQKLKRRKGEYILYLNEELRIDNSHFYCVGLLDINRMQNQ